MDETFEELTGIAPKEEAELLFDLAETLNYRLATVLDLLVQYPWLADMINSGNKKKESE